MKSFVALFLILVVGARGQPDWTGIDYYPGYNFFPVARQAGEVCSFSFPAPGAGDHYPAFLVETNAASVSLSNRIITATFSLECSPDAVLRFGGQGRWNLGPMPPNTRIYFSTVTMYNNGGTPTNFWFNSTWVELTNNTGTATLSVTLNNPSAWTDSYGESESNAFWNAAANVREVGVCFGGGDFYDIGDAMVSGTATFHLLSFSTSTVAPPTNLAIIPL